MREILFRGKHKDGEWFYGIPIQHIDGDYQIINGKSGVMCLTTVISNTIGQYTELTDKNGTKIFEGDIVDFSDRSDGDSYGVVQYDAEETEFGIVYDSIYKGLGRHYHSRDIEVIGNIYDNPKLLELEV